DHFARRRQPILDQCLIFRSRIRWSRTSKETPRKSWPTIISGSALCIAAIRLRSSMVSLTIGDTNPKSAMALQKRSGESLTSPASLPLL
ncbi:dna polymerase alpha catalytic subunit, partial [Moniliophthora roreri]